LSGRDLEAAQSHVADCARCQAVLSALVHTFRPDGVKGVHDAPMPRRWLAWFVPLTAAAAAVAIWVAVPRGPAGEPPQVAEVHTQPAERAAPATPAPAIQLQQSETTKKQEPAAAKRDVPHGRSEELASGLSKDADRRELDRLSAPAPPPAAPPAAAAEARQTFQETSANAVAQKAAPVTTLRSVAVAPQWRITGTTLERSTDRGSTWTAVTTGVEVEWTALSSPSPDVCWVVGRQGVVLRTINGESFSRVTFPEITNLSAVTAADAQAATVTVSDGRAFTTADGGVTWHIVP